MKKLITSLALIFVATLCLTVVFAADETVGGGLGPHNVGVNGQYNPGLEKANVYSVDVAWENLTFVYKESDRSWNPETHQYELSNESGWKESNATISVTNHSNADIVATPSYVAATGYEAVDMQFEDESGNALSSIRISSADNGINGAPGTAQTGIIYVTPAGALPVDTENEEIGTITVTIAAVAEAQ